MANVRDLIKMTPEEVDAFLHEPGQTMSVATIGPDGRPQLSAVWFLAEGSEVKVSLNVDRQKVKNLQRNPAVNLFILDSANPQRYLEVRGDAEIADDPDRAFAGGPVSEKYGVDVRTFDAPGATRVVVTVRPTRCRRGRWSR